MRLHSGQVFCRIYGMSGLQNIGAPRAGGAPEESASAVFRCLAGKKSRSDREKDDACIKLLFNGCRRLAVGYRWRRKIVDDPRKIVRTRAVHCERRQPRNKGVKTTMRL